MVSVTYNMDKQISIGTGVGEVVALVTAVAVAQQWGSALYTRYTHQPLKELIHALNNKSDISARRYHGSNIYDPETGRYMTMQGEIKQVAMGKIVAEKGEEETQLGTVIVCLSVALNPKGPNSLSVILADAIMLFVHGTIERQMAGTTSILQGKIEKYATAVLSRDKMCGKLEKTRKYVSNLVESMAPEISAPDTMFLPPSTRSEAGDFVQFLVDLWRSDADGKEIFTRSIKLLGLALLLSEYGWVIDVYVESKTGTIKPIKTDTKALSVIYSMADTQKARERQYVENHRAYVRTSRNEHEFFPTAVCVAGQMGPVSGMSFAKTITELSRFETGYKHAQQFCLAYHISTNVCPQGRISMTVQKREESPPGIFLHLRSCRELLTRFFPPSMPDIIWDLTSSALCKLYPTVDWGHIHHDASKQRYPNASFTALLSLYEGNCENLWAIAGAVLGILDTIITSLVNLPVESIIRTPAGESISKFVSGSANWLNNLLTTGGIEPGPAIQLCSTRLCGVDPNNLRFASNTNPNSIVGYWNGQQGILVTPIFERSLYYDLPAEKLRPLTFFSIPIEGMPTDDGGWIRPGTVQSPAATGLKNTPMQFAEPRGCDVIMEYRPHFEVDSNSVVAAVYIDGVFCNLIPLGDTLSYYWHLTSQCDHQKSDQQDMPSGSPLKYLNLKHLITGSGYLQLPDNRDVLIIGPQGSRVSRLFTSIMYKVTKPIIQQGCLGCALQLVPQGRGTVIIPPTREARMDESMTTAPVLR
jgi:hypothetical protein